MDYFYLVFTQLESFIIMILFGISAIKTRVLNENSLTHLSKLIMKLILPIMIFHKSINGANRTDIFLCLPEVVLSTIFMYVILFFAGSILKKLLHLSGNHGRVFHASTMFGNIGFIGIPLIIGILPERGMLYMALFAIIDSSILWTVGYYLTLPEEKLADNSITANLKNVFNPAMMSILLSILFILMEWKLPFTLNNALGSIGETTTPLSLIYIGGTFCFYNIKKFAMKIEYYSIVFAKMIFIPLFIFTILRLFHVHQEIIIFITTLSGMPSMTVIAMFARANGSDEDCAVGAIMITTIFCLVTLPLVAYFMSS